MTVETLIAELSATATRMSFTLTPEAADLLALAVDGADLASADRREEAIRTARRHLMRAAFNATARGSKRIDLPAMALALADAAGPLPPDSGQLQQTPE